MGLPIGNARGYSRKATPPHPAATQRIARGKPGYQKKHARLLTSAPNLALDVTQDVTAPAAGK
jgi:hypothetical protein